MRKYKIPQNFDDAEMAALWGSAASLEEMSRHFKRKKGAILSRIKKLGLGCDE